MSATAYVLVSIDQKTLRVIDVRVYSEPTPSRMRGSPIYAELFRMSGPDFHTARLYAIKRYREGGWLYEGLARRFQVSE